MKLGDIPIAEMTDEQLHDAIATLQANREALLAEHAAKKREAAAPKPPKAPATKRAPKEQEQWQKDLLGMLTGGLPS